MDFTSLRIGDIQSGNYLEINNHGVIRLHGIATCWDDEVGNLVNRRLYNTKGKIDYNLPNNSVTVAKGGSITVLDDCLVDSIQYAHAALSTGKFRQHFHWEQPDDSAYTWTRYWRIQSNGVLTTTEWQTDSAVANTAADVFTYPGSGTFNQITRFPDIDMSSAGISATVQTRVCRTDTETPDVEMIFLDAHVELDSFGSDEEYQKWEVD